MRSTNSRSVKTTVLAGIAVLGLLTQSTVFAECQPYLVESNNGNGGFRFMHDAQKFYPVNTGTRYEGLICDRKSFRIELAKKNPGARVRFSIDGKPYEFRKFFDISF